MQARDEKSALIEKRPQHCEEIFWSISQDSTEGLCLRGGQVCISCWPLTVIMCKNLPHGTGFDRMRASGLRYGGEHMNMKLDIGKDKERSLVKKVQSH